MTLYQTGETAPLAGSDHIHNILGFKLFGQYAVALLQVTGSLPQMKFAQIAHAFRSGFRQMVCHRLILLFRVLKQPKLDGVVTIGSRRFPLGDHTGTRFHKCYRNHLPVRCKYLRHANFLAENSWTHSCYLGLTSTSCRMP